VSRRTTFVCSSISNDAGAGLFLSRPEAVEIATRALRRSSAEVHLEMKRHLSGLATVAATAPLIGLFGTVIGILDAFKGCIGEKWFCEMMILEGLCEALTTTALGLLVAIPAAWHYNFLSARLEIFDIEMRCASLELTTYLHLLPYALGTCRAGGRP
jgi:biopolymer transport protein ExbB